MSIIDWAEQECRIACKCENPEYDFDSDDFDYGCSCYKSALKAYKSLCEDLHSGASFEFTKNILIRLIEGHPLTPIKDEDFFINIEVMPQKSPSYLKERGLKSDLQCPRMSSLFRTETLDGKVTYEDIDRFYFINIEEPSDTYKTNSNFLDEMFPITMPYMPKKNKYKIYEQTFLTDKSNGDFDTRGIIYVITPEGEKVDVNIYKAQINNKFVDITKEEYEERLKRRIDKVSAKVTEHLLWTLISNCSSYEETIRREKVFKNIDSNTKDNWTYNLNNLCIFFDNPDNWKYNTFDMYQALCKNNIEEYKDIKELCDIANYLKTILEKL